ncbi:MAG TPA: TcfC E-set like domain-containing protein, partial [Sphingomicrobium sp.]|nr:TcfC E-set like domain-containing protein [Sphingomicrobium sp.]
MPLRPLISALAIALALLTLLVPTFAAAAAAAAASGAAGHAALETEAPDGFDDLAQPRELLVDVYFGGKKVGNAVAVARPGFLEFRDPKRVASLIPNLADVPDVADSLTGDLPTHANLICSQSNTDTCGKLTNFPGIIFDEDRFRLDLFVSPGMLRVTPLAMTKFLEPPHGPVSLTSSVGLALSGAQGRAALYNLQNRTIVGVGPARVRTDLSYASKLGLLVDDFVGELDRPNLRYSAGLFWAPGLDLTGRRRIAGVGFGTQFDTRADRESLMGTSLILFLSQPSRVEFLIDGRLVASRSYDAGNDILDTSDLPDGSYPLVLRIQDSSGAMREERRFFVKTPEVAPVDQPLYFAYAGMLANTRVRHPVSLSNTLYYQGGTARRLSRPFALDLSLIGTQKKVMAEVGAWLLSPLAQVRAAALLSTAGDKAVLVQGTSSGQSRLNFSFDLRRVWSHDGRPLIPLPSTTQNFEPDQPTSAQIGGSYVQASGTLGYRIGAAYLSMLGSLRRDAHQRTDYSIGPGLTWPVLSRNGLQLTFQADAQRTRTTTQGSIGLHLIYTAKRVTATGTAGYGSISSRDHSAPSAPSASRAVGSLSAGYYYENADRTQLSLDAGIERSIDTTAANAGATVYSRFGNARADVLDNFGGRGGLGYGLTLQSAVAISGGEIGVGARDLNDSAIIVDVGGDAGSTNFEVLVNEQPMGHVRAGGQLPIHLEPYRSYAVR